MVNGPQPTGGLSLPTGEAVLVTPSGEIVGSARIPTSRGRGGIRGPSRSSIEAARKATVKRQKAEAEVEKKRVETQQRQVQTIAREQTRQQRIQAGRISGQVSDTRIQPPAFEELRPSDFSFTSGFRRGGREATRAFFTERIPQFVTGLGGAITGLAVGDTRRLREIDPFRAFQDVGQRRGEEAIQVPQFGTVTQAAPRGFLETTRFDVLRERRLEAGISPELATAPVSIIAERTASRIERDVIREFQGRVDTGDLTAKEATAQAGRQFRRQFKEQTSGLSSLEAAGLRQRSGERISQTLTSLAPAAGITALGLLPGGQVPAAALSVGVGGFFATRGTQKIREGEITSGALDIGTGALFAGTGFAGLGAAAGRLETQILSSRLSRLESRPFRVGGRELLRREDDVLLGLVGRRGIGDFGLQETRAVVPVFRTGATPTGLARFTIGGGQLETRTLVGGLPVRVGGFGTEFNLPTIKDISTATFTARGAASRGALFGTRDFGLRLPGDQFTGSFGRLDIVRGDRVFSSGFGGIAQPQQDIIKIIGGRARTARGRRPFSGFVSDPSVTLRTDISSGGVIQRLGTRVPQADSFSIIGSGKPSDIGVGRQFQKSLQEQAGAFGTTVGRETIIRTPKIPTSRGLGISTAPPVTTQRDAFRISTQQPSLAFKEPTLKDITSPVIGLDVGQAQVRGRAQRGRTTSIQAPRSITESLITSDVLQRQLSDIGTQTRRATKRVSQQPSPIAPTPFFDLGFGGAPGAFGFGGVGGFPPVVFPTFPTGRVPTRGRKRRPGRIAPSLTGIALADLGDIFGGDLPTSSLPLTRFVPKTRKKKTKKKK